MNKYMKLIGIALVAVLFFTACNSSDSEGLGGLVTAPDEKFNAKLCVISSLKDGSTVTTTEQATAITKYINEKRSDAFVILVDRADAVYRVQNMENPIVRTAFETDRFSATAFNRFNGNTMEGGYLLVDKYNFYGLKTDKRNGMHTTRRESSLKIAKDCYLKTLEEVTFQGTNSDLPVGQQNIKFHRELSTLRMSSQEHIKNYIEKGLEPIKSVRPILLHFGTVKSSLVNELKGAVNNMDSEYEVSIAEGSGSSEYSVFVIAHENFWAISKTEKDNIVGDINAYTLNLMW